MRIGRDQGDDMSSSDYGASTRQTLQYADEVLCANWNPLARLLVEPMVPANAPSLDGGDAEAFLARLYRCQQA